MSKKILKLKFAIVIDIAIAIELFFVDYHF